MSYKATITANVSEAMTDVKDLRLALTHTNMYLRMLGLSGNQRQALQEIIRGINYVRTVQMLLTASSASSIAGLGLRVLGLSSYGRMVRTISSDIDRLGVPR